MPWCGGWKATTVSRGWTYAAGSFRRQSWYNGVAHSVVLGYEEHAYSNTNDDAAKVRICGSKLGLGW